MSINLTYANKSGISLQDVLGVISTIGVGKRYIKDQLDTTKSIDILLRKLEDEKLIDRTKSNNRVLYTLITETKKQTEIPTLKHSRNDYVFDMFEKPIEDDDIVLENPFRFVQNFFTSTLKGNVATPFFRRKDDHIVKSLYSKFTSMCIIMDDYSITSPNLPFYKVFSIDKENRTVLIHHIDMNRTIRGEYSLFKFEDQVDVDQF